jgi:hypothetical protein
MDLPAESKEYSLFNSIVEKLSPHPQQAQIVVAMGGQGQGLSRALELLASGPETEPLEAVLVVSASPGGCQEAVLRLTENGFKRLQAIYPPAPRQ